MFAFTVHLSRNSEETQMQFKLTGLTVDARTFSTANGSLFFAEDASMSETKHKSLFDQLAMNSVIKQQEVKRL